MQSTTSASASPKPPRPVFEDVFAFPPNRNTLGGTAYLLVDQAGTMGNLLVDCPAWNEATQAFLQAQGGVRWLFLTHRGAIASVREIQQATGCEVVLQEQEAYLLPGLTVTAFAQEFTFSPDAQAVWTAGHSPGSACLHVARHDGGLFSGRHLLPNAQGEPAPLRMSKTFHWRRQIQSVQRLLDRYSPATLQWLCPGASTGYLRGQMKIDRAYERLAQLDLEALLAAKPLL